MTVPVFCAPCYDLLFKLTVNISDTGVCAILLQFHPISYFFEEVKLSPEMVFSDRKGSIGASYGTEAFRSLQPFQVMVVWLIRNGQ